jgi:thiamine-phosphate pyrophosphorylase
MGVPGPGAAFSEGFAACPVRAEKSVRPLYPWNLIWIMPAEGNGWFERSSLFVARPLDGFLINRRGRVFMKDGAGKLSRILDANFNRAREGLRVIEEIARFILDDGCLTGRCKHYRHLLQELAETFPGGAKNLLAARNSPEDVGFACSEEAEGCRGSIWDLLTANSKRVQEALRVLEEYSKLFGREEGKKFKELRYQVYELEKELAGRVENVPAFQSKAKVDYSLCVITGERFSRGRTLFEVAAEAIAGGATVIQLREKEFSTRRLIGEGLALRRLTLEKKVAFIVNDRVDVALAVDADGVHLGQDDLPLPDARKILGPGKIIGVSAHNLEQAVRAQEQGADYIGVGPVFETNTKDTGYAPLGLDVFRSLKEKIFIPVLAIGGIKTENAGAVVRAGADGVAVISAVAGAPEIREASRALALAVREAKQELMAKKEEKQKEI